MDGYVDLIKRGDPGFVEVKGVTFCGGKKPQIGMKNVPWHEEVIIVIVVIVVLIGGGGGIVGGIYFYFLFHYY